MTQNLGRQGETMAAEYMINKGYRLLSSNERYKDGEIDLVCSSKDGILVFVEVKTMTYRGDGYLKPEDNMTPAKMRKFQRACETYVSKHQDIVDAEKGWRMDLVAISVGDGDQIRHYENV